MTLDPEKKIYFLDRILDSIDQLSTKLVSGRFITLFIDSIVYPGAVGVCGYLTIQGKMQADTFIAVLGGYALLVKETRTRYFDRGETMDKYKQENTSEKETTNAKI